MVPRMAILQGLELVGVRVSLRNGTLGDAVNTIHLHSAQLAQAVPMNGSAVGLVVVLDMDDELVAPAGLDQGPGILFVEHLAAGLVEAVRVELFLIGSG